MPGSDTWPTAHLDVNVPERVLAFPRADLLPVLVLLIMTGLTAWSHFSLQHRLYDLDTLTFYIPWYSFMGERLRAFDVPGWMPYQFSGAPFAADPQSGWMYMPAMVFFTLFSGAAAQTAFLIFHWLLAGLSMYALARVLGMRPSGALVAAVALEFGTYLEHTHTSLLRAQLGAWLPLTLLGIELALRSRRWEGRILAWSLTGFAVTQVLAAWVGQGAYLALLVAGSYLAYRTLSASTPSLVTWRDRILQLMAGGGTILLVTFGLNAAALIPRLEWNGRSNLAGGDYSDLYQTGGRGWSFARIVDRLTSYDNGLLYWYVGVATITLALVGAVVAFRRFAVPYFVALTGIAIILTLDDTPVHRLFYLLPRFETLHQHQPNRTLVLLTLSLPILAGAAIDRLSTWTRLRVALIVPLVPLILYGLIAVTLPDDLSGIGAPTRNAVIATTLLLFGAVLLGRRRIAWPAFQPATIVTCAAVFLVWWDPTGSAIAHSLRTGQSDPVADGLVTAYTATTNPGGAGGFLQAQMASQPPFRYFGIDELHWTKKTTRSAWTYSARFNDPAVVEILPGPRAMRLELDGIQGYNPVHLRRYDEYFEAMNGQSQNYHVSEVLRNGASSPLINLLNVRYIVVPNGRDGGWDGAGLVEAGIADREVYADEHVRVLENDDALPRAWIVHEARTVPEGGALPVLADGSVDPRTVALIEEHVPDLALPRAGANEMVQFLASDSPDRLRFAANLAAPGLVVLSEIYDPGWHAYVDGKRVPVLVTDHILRSVPVSAGSHTIELRYEPATLKIGLAITTATTITILIVAVIYLLRPRPIRRRTAARMRNMPPSPMASRSPFIPPNHRPTA
ncbi:MAG TPA: YfhO family protein [Thermomicrobiales bacterium]|nr:YfhO family protein [Thermomicrobiales bacterium]